MSCVAHLNAVPRRQLRPARQQGFPAKAVVPRERPAWFPGGNVGLLLLVALGLLTGCSTLKPLPPVDLSAAGWTVQRGQAVWKFGADAPEVVGDLMIATRPDGETFAQFSKAPLTVAVARATANAWELDFAMFGRRVAGRGEPDDRFALFQLARASRGATLPDNWALADLGDGRWRLANERTGEFLEGYWEP